MARKKTAAKKAKKNTKMHKMPDGHMMSDKQMKKNMGKKMTPKGMVY